MRTEAEAEAVVGDVFSGGWPVQTLSGRQYPPPPHVCPVIVKRLLEPSNHDLRATNQGYRISGPFLQQDIDRAI